MPFTVTEIDTRLKTLIAFGTDIFIVGDRGCVRLWNSGSGFDAAGLDYIIQMRQKHYLCREHERTLKKGDRVALLGHGAVVQQANDEAAVVVLGNRVSLQIARKNIVLNKQNMRWECEAMCELVRS